MMHLLETDFRADRMHPLTTDVKSRKANIARKELAADRKKKRKQDADDVDYGKAKRRKGAKGAAQTKKNFKG